MQRSSHGLVLVRSVLAAAWLLACGGSQPPAAAPGEPQATPASAAEADGGDVWKDSMSAKEKGAFMKKYVVPEMAKLFSAFDAKAYAQFGCKTCHGPDLLPKPVDFLPALHIKDGKIVESAEHPQLAQFMGEQVVPHMAKLFGKPPYDPATNSGFGCGGCHKMSM